MNTNKAIIEIHVDLLTTQQLIDARERFTADAVADKMTKGIQISNVRRQRIKRLTAEITARERVEKKK